MNNMKNQFINYEISLDLKELGFNEECLGYYICRNSSYGIDDLLITSEYVDLLPFDSSSCKTPLWQQAIDWLRESHNITIDIAKIYNGTDNYHFAINLIWEYFEGTYYEAREAAIIKAIEIIKENKL